MDDEKLVCYACGAINDMGDTAWVEDGDDMAATCADCGSEDVVSYETYIEELE